MSNSYATGEKRRRPAHVPSFSFFLTLPFVFNYVYMCVMVGGGMHVHMSAVPREAQGLEASWS